MTKSPPPLRPTQLLTLQRTLLTSPFPYPLIYLHGESSSGKSHYLRKCLFGGDAMMDSMDIGDVFMRDCTEMRERGHSIGEVYPDPMKTPTTSAAPSEPPPRLIISIDAFELPHTSHALIALLSKKLSLACPAHYDIVKMLHADERYSKSHECKIFKARRRGGVTLHAALFLQEMERIQESYHTPDLIICLTNATEYLSEVRTEQFNHWMSVFTNLYTIFEGRVCLVIESQQPPEHLMRDVHMECNYRAIYFPRYTVDELRRILKQRHTRFTHENEALFDEFLSLFLGTMHATTREISLLHRMVQEIYPSYSSIPSQLSRVKFHNDLLRVRLKNVQNPKLVYLEKAHSVNLFDEHDKNIQLGSDEWLDESTNKLSHRQIEQTLIDPYCINKDMTLLHALVLVATYVAKVQPKELDANMYITEEEGISGKRRRKGAGKKSSGTTTHTLPSDDPTLAQQKRDASKPIPLSRINQIFYHILEDSDQDGLKMIRKQRWLTHDIHEAVRHLCSLGMMRDANAYGTLSDKKTFFLVVDQAFVELIAAPFGVSLTTYGIGKKSKA